MAKKKFSAKQLAAQRLFAKRARAGTLKKGSKKKSTPKKKSSKPRKTNKPKSPKKTMAKNQSLASKIPLINNPTFKKAAIGVGTATLGAAVLTAVLPQVAQNPIVKPVLAFVGGGIPGVVAQIFTQGGISGFSNILGGSNGNGGGSNAGFA